MATIWIDGTSFEAKAGENLLEAILGLGLDLPYFCWHPAMGSVGSCRQCAVVQYANEEDTRGRLVMGCMTPVADGTRISLNGEWAKDFRKGVVESLMVNHPHDCPVCGEGGECHLQDMTVMTGHRDRRYRGLKNTYRNQYLGPFLHHEMNRCITCYRCVRFYQDYAGGKDLAALAASDHVYFGRHEEGVLESEFAGNLVEVCPTGVFTDKNLVNDYTRKWDLQSAPSVCGACALGCNTLPGERYGRLKRVHNRFNDQVNGYFLCDRGRFGVDWVNDASRFSFAGLREADGRYRAVQSEDALRQIADWCADGQRVAGIGSPRASLESNGALRRLVGAENFCDGIGERQRPAIEAALSALCDGTVPTPSLRQVEQADAVLILGEDVSNTAPLIALSLRQSVRNAAFEKSRGIGLLDWQDAAVRNLAQESKSPLYEVTIAETRLADIARESRHMAPGDIARFGYAVASALGISGLDLGETDQDMLALADLVAADLRAAKLPLVVTGSGCQDADVVRAAATVAEALHKNNDAARLTCCLPECNSAGVSMLSKGVGPTLAELNTRVRSGEIDTLLIVENDLYRRGHANEIDFLLDSVSNVVVIDVTSTPTLERAHLALPAASSVESEGTLVSSEGRAQRFFPVIELKEERRAAWRWIVQIGKACNRVGFDEIESFDQLLDTLTADETIPAAVLDAAPSSSWRGTAGLKVPRQPHRYSGRTAIRANVSVHEPRQSIDRETSLSYTMEGTANDRPAGMLPFVWAPGWNSNQSLHQFQTEPGGPLKGGTAGVRLIEPGGAQGIAAAPIPLARTQEPGHWLLVPLYRVFGSDELSAQSASVAERGGRAEIEIHPEDAERLAIGHGDGLAIDCAISGSGEYPVRLNASLPRGCAGFPVGMPGTGSLLAGEQVPLRCVNNFEASRATLIASDAEAAR